MTNDEFQMAAPHAAGVNCTLLAIRHSLFAF